MRALTMTLVLLISSVLLLGWYSFGGMRLGTPTRELVFATGPVDLPARVTHEQMQSPALVATVLETSGWLHGFRVELVDGQGRTVPSEVLHHVKVLSGTQRELFSPIMMRVVGAGAETKPVQLPRSLGYPLRRGDTLVISAMLHNPTATAYQGLRVRVIAQYTPRTATSEPEAVYPFLVHVEPDSNNVYDLPPGYSERSRLIQPAIAGRVIGLGGHLHRYGVRLELQDLTTGAVLWTVESVRDSAGNVLEVPSRFFLLRSGPHIKPDHVYRISGVYFNPTSDTLRAAGMTTFGGALQPEAGVAWPALDRADPIYRRSLAEELGTGLGGPSAPAAKHHH